MVVGSAFFFSIFGTAERTDARAEPIAKVFHEFNGDIVVKRAVFREVFVSVGEGEKTVVFIER